MISPVNVNESSTRSRYLKCLIFSRLMHRTAFALKNADICPLSLTLIEDSDQNLNQLYNTCIKFKKSANALSHFTNNPLASKVCYGPCFGSVNLGFSTNCEWKTKRNWRLVKIFGAFIIKIRTTPQNVHWFYQTISLFSLAYPRLLNYTLCTSYGIDSMLMTIRSSDTSKCFLSYHLLRSVM